MHLFIALFNMKVFVLMTSVIFLTACNLTHLNEVKHAEKMLSYFQCNNIESVEMTHSSITAYYEQSLALSRQKAESYIQSYKDGNELFDLPLSEVIEQQYLVYQAACENLGGIEPEFIE